MFISDITFNWIMKKIEEDLEEQKILEREINEDLQGCLANIHIGANGAITLSRSVLGYIDDAGQNLKKIQDLEDEIMKVLQKLIQMKDPNFKNNSLKALLDFEDKKVDQLKKELVDIGSFLRVASQK